MVASTAEYIQSKSRRQAGINAGWARGLSRTFRRVALFSIDGTQAKVAAVQGMGLPPLGGGLSLLEQTPLRWAVEAASPILGAGSAPGGAVIAATLGVSTPRAYAVIPLLIKDRLVALAYVDQAAEPLPIAAASELFAFVGRLLKENDRGRAPTGRRVVCKSTASRPNARRARQPALSLVASPRVAIAPPPPPQDCFDASFEAMQTIPAAQNDDSVDAFVEELAVAVATESLEAWGPEPIEPRPEEDLDYDFPAEQVEEHGIAEPQQAVPNISRQELATAVASGQAVVTPNGVFLDAAESRPDARKRKPWRKRLLLAGAVAALLLAGLVVPMAPTSIGDPGERVINIPRESSVAQIANVLKHEGIVRSALAFRLLTRVTGADRNLKAGVYRLPTGAWTWTVLRELHQGQVNVKNITIPEGLTLSEVAAALEGQGLARATDVLRTARDPELLEQFGIPAQTVEGFLFPETYRLAQGLSAREILTVMIEEFYRRLAELPEAGGISPEDLLRKVTLASIVEREARDKNELDRVAGVFKNRVERNMRLESCATVQYILGKPKKRLTVSDVRRPSPYNTYLHPGLPPGPIANPGFGALKATFAPESHDYLFFFAKEDGSHRHIFSKTYAEHQARQRRFR